MPYPTLGDLPDAVQKMPKHAQEIYQAAFNSAWEQYKDRGKQQEALSHATAWAAVEKKYKKVNGRWVTRESKVKEANVLSDKSKRNLLQSALMSEYSLNVESPIPKKLQVEEVFDGELTYDVDGQTYKATYEMNEDGVKIGEPKKVLKQIVYKSMESLRTTYSEIIQEAGRRNANLDSSRIKKIVALCQELLDSEEPDEGKAKEALKEADKVLTLIKEQAVMKTEDGIKFPATAFAYVPDAEKSSSWKLRLWEDLTKKVTKAQLSKAAATLSPGGFKGQKVAILAADMSAVKRKIRAEYRKLEVKDEDIPRWVKETMSRQYVLSYVPLTEATFDKGRATIIIIKPGFNADKSRYYPAEMLKRDYKVFEGQKMYADHPTETEEKELPERSIKNTGWVAVLKDVTCDEGGVVTGVAEIIEPWLMTKLATLRDKGLLSEMGISINAVGRATEATIEGEKTLVIEELTGSRSVDFVTEPGASGLVTLYESSRNQDIDLIELATLKEKRPDLVKLIETDVRAEIKLEVKHKMELGERVTELEGQITDLTTERDDLKTKITEAEKEKAKAEAQATIKEAVDKAELPDAAKERLIERFKDAESADGIEEAVKAEIDYIAKLSEAGKVKGFGISQPDAEKDRDALKESFKKDYIAQGKTEEEAEKLAETAASGR